MNYQSTASAQNHLYAGTAGALGATMLLWLGRPGPTLPAFGTVLLALSLVPLASGLRGRGGAILGLSFGILLVAARLGSVDPSHVLSGANVITVLAMMAIGVVSGAFFGSSKSSCPVLPVEELRSGPDVPPCSEPAARSAPVVEEDILRTALAKHRAWMLEWDRKQQPWVSFDNHIREVLHLLTGARRIRCYRVGNSKQLYLLNRSSTDEAVSPSNEPLLSHAVTTGRRFVASSPSTGPMIQELAGSGSTPLAWVIPIRRQQATIGLITVESFEGGSIREDRLEVSADLVEDFWRYVHEMEELHIARLTDRASGVLNRVEFLLILNEAVERCYEAHEPVVVFLLCAEGIRGLDDAGQWQERNKIIEAVGQTIRARVRQEDVVGRLSDDLFVAVLRRLDVPLAELISRKLMLSAAEASLDVAPTHSLTLRGGLAGSGMDHVPAEVLLSQASCALKEARAKGVSMVSNAEAASLTADQS